MVRYFLLILTVICADQLSKLWIVNSFQLLEIREVVPGFFNLVYVTNTGAAFSMFADIDSPLRHYGFLLVGILAIIGLTVYYASIKEQNRLFFIAAGLIAGGAAGNLIDRIRYGSVVDFLDFYLGNSHWPAFNLADSAICIGAGLFLVIQYLVSRQETEQAGSRT